MIAVSACLTGIPCRYNGEDAYNDNLIKVLGNEEILAVCPERNAGLPIPRKPAEIIGGTGIDVLDGKAHVYDQTGRNLTQEYIAGAAKTAHLMKVHGIRKAFLKEYSPSCGVKYIYNGQFSKCVIQGVGITTAMLLYEDIKVFNETEGQDFLIKERE